MRVLLGVVVVQFLDLEPNPLVQLIWVVSVGAAASARRNVFARQSHGELWRQQSTAQKQDGKAGLEGLVALHFTRTAGLFL
jgi:hypothetical protein